MSLRTISLLAVVSPLALMAQNDTAVLSGRVTDPSGLGVSNAQIRLTRQSTGSVRETVAKAEGEYRIDLLEPGDYSIRVTAPGFKTFEDSNLHLQVAQSSNLDVPLVVGTLAEEIRVEADVSPLNAETIAQ